MDVVLIDVIVPSESAVISRWCLNSGQDAGDHDSTRRSVSVTFKTYIITYTMLVVGFRIMWSLMCQYILQQQL